MVISALAHLQLCLIDATYAYEVDSPNAVKFDYSLLYWQNAEGEALLIFGDDHGATYILQFWKPRVQLFAAPFNKDEGTQKIYFPVR